MEQFGMANDLLQRMRAQASQQGARLPGNGTEIIFHHLRPPGEAGPQSLILCGDANRTGVEMALARHHATHRQKRGGAEAELVGAEQRGYHNVARKFESAVHAKTDVLPQPCLDERAVYVTKAEFPGHAGVLDGTQGSCAGAAVRSAEG